MTSVGPDKKFKGQILCLFFSKR